MGLYMIGRDSSPPEADRNDKIIHNEAECHSERSDEGAK